MAADALGVVSLTFRELSKIISRKYTTQEITFMIRISNWNFVRVPKAWLWAHVQSFILKFWSQALILQYTNFERIFWRARETLVKQPPGSLRRQAISSHDIDYEEYVGPGLTWGRILSTCVMSMWSNDIKCKYMFILPLKNLARKGFIWLQISVTRRQPINSSGPRACEVVERKLLFTSGENWAVLYEGCSMWYISIQLHFLNNKFWALYMQRTAIKHWSWCQQQLILSFTEPALAFYPCRPPLFSFIRSLLFIMFYSAKPEISMCL